MQASRILVVDDDQQLAHGVCEVLRVFGHDATHRSTVESAYVALAGGDDYDVVILDLLIGDSRGERLVLKMRAKKLPVPPIILTSAEPLATLKQAARVVGARKVLQKPFSLEVLIETISQL